MKKLVVVVFILIVLGGMFVFRADTQQKLGKEEVKQQTMDVESTLSESLLLAQETEDNKITSSYTKIQAEQLQDELKDAKQTLEQPAETNVQQTIKKETQLISSASDQLKQLHKSPDDKQTVNKVHTSLQSLLKQTERIDDSL